MERLPVVFVSHGSPMHAIAPSEASKAWRDLAARLPRPRAVVIASAHWETAMPMATGSAQPETIHDFGGFPQELYKIRYAAPGAPALAQDVVRLLKQAGMTAGVDGCRGLDHGAWVPLRWMYEAADVPVVEIAVQPGRGTAHHVDLGRALGPLRDDNVLVIGSGHVTHNLRDWMGNRSGGAPLPYARAFSDWLADRLAAGATDDLIHYRDRAPGASRAHPSEEHFLPLFVAWGAAGEHPRSERFFAGFEGTALSMDAYLFH